ncbi:hypothetical protein BH09ACT1_BH09ACT1_24050 [soil metagenome]
MELAGDSHDTVIVPSRAVSAESPGDTGIPDDDTVVPGPAVVTPIHDLVEPPVIVRDAAPTAAPPPVVPPATYRFSINAGRPMDLEVPVIIGRRPSMPRIATGRPLRLVPVLSPTSEVSSTHLELRQHGTSVVVTDLRSTNGTIVTVPGVAALKLHQGESVVVSAGTLVDIGDDNIIEILPMPRLVPAPSTLPEVSARERLHP